MSVGLPQTTVGTQDGIKSAMQGGPQDILQSALKAAAKTSVALGLAPMEGVTDLATRLWFSQTSPPDFATTPFLRVTQDYPYKRVPAIYCPEISTLKNAVPFQVAPQLMGSEAGDISRIACELLKLTEFVDINCGCPSPKVVGHCAGSGLLADPHVFVRFLEGLSRALGPQSIAIKMRTGFDDDAEFPGLLSAVDDMGPMRLTVHGRTRRDRYLGQARWPLIARAATQLHKAKVVGSGDIVDVASFLARMAHAPGLTAVIVGRGALRNPWIFQELRSQKRVEISSQTLLLSLACYALLQEALVTNPSALFDLALAGVFLSPCGTDSEKWQKLYERLTKLFWSEPPSLENLEVSPGTVARVKMLWNSLRSALPVAFFSPEVLRSRTFAQLAERLSAIARGLSEHEVSCFRTDLGSGKALITLTHRPELDWVYAGGKDHPDAAPPATSAVT